MATTTITLPMFTPGTESWLKSSVEFASATLLYIDKDARQFYDKAKELIDNKAWELYFDDEPKTWERFLTEALKIDDIEDTLSVLRGVEYAIASGVTGPIPSTMARDQLIIKNAPAVGKVGAPEGNNNAAKVKEENKPDSGKDCIHYGNSLEYQAARLKRDRPDLAAKVEGGELLLREATNEAGITKPAAKQWRVPANNIKTLVAYIKKHLDNDQINQLVLELTKEVDVT